MNIVVTGALGYLGSSLIRKLPGQFPNSEIYLLDNLSTGQPSALKKLPKNARYNFIEADIRNFNLKALRLGPSDAVIHLAGLSRPSDSYKNPKEFESVNSEGALRIAKICAETSTAFFFPSTTSVYHQIAGRIIKDCSSCLQPQTPYADSKLAAERGLSKIKGLRYTILRFGTIYGLSPVMSYQTAVNKFCWQSCIGQPITVWKTALNQWRPYLDIRDAVGLILFFLKKRRFLGETFHAATQNARVSDILKIIRIENPNSKIMRIPSKVMNSLSYRVETDGIEKLGFVFKGDLKKSVKQVLRSLPRF